MVVVVYIIGVVVVLLGIMLWSTNEVFGDAINDLKDFIDDYIKLTTKKIKALESEIRILKERVEALESEIKTLKGEVEQGGVEHNYPY